MWMTIYNSLAEAERRDPDLPPAHCPHPSRCLRSASAEPRSFSEPCTTRTLLLDRYRRLIAQQCACNGDRQADVKI